MLHLQHDSQHIPTLLRSSGISFNFNWNNFSLNLIGILCRKKQRFTSQNLEENVNQIRTAMMAQLDLTLLQLEF